MMALLSSVALLFSILANAAAQSDDGTKVWAAVAYVHNGERTPLLGDLETILTPEGAQQMYRQGQAFRNRYLSTSNDSASGANATIQGLDSKALDNQVVNVISTADGWVSSGAMAFMQALYPPAMSSFAASAGGPDLVHNFTGEGNTTQYPLDGYQYPILEMVSSSDQNSPSIQGTVGCTAWRTAASQDLTVNDDLVSAYKESLHTYQNIFSAAPLKGTVPEDQINFGSAYELYDYVNYMYAHNETVFDTLNVGADVLPVLERFAVQAEYAKTGVNGSNLDTVDNQLRGIAALGLASQVASSLNKTAMQSGDGSAKLTLLFGQHTPLTSFFSWAGLRTNADAQADGPFSKLPKPGAAMVFELISQNDEDSLPDVDDLSVRFFYRSSADESESFELQSLFDSGFGGNSIPFSAFYRTMTEHNHNNWCDICQPSRDDAPALHLMCAGLDATSASGGTDLGSGHGGSGVSAPVGGVIGAAVTLALTAVTGLALFFLFGFRLQRPQDKRSETSLGGFRGSERMPGDRDFTISKEGLTEERHESWEMHSGHRDMKGGETGPTMTVSYGNTNREDGESIVGAEATKIRESI